MASGVDIQRESKSKIEADRDAVYRRTLQEPAFRPRNHDGRRIL